MRRRRATIVRIDGKGGKSTLPRTRPGANHYAPFWFGRNLRAVGVDEANVAVR